MICNADGVIKLQKSVDREKANKIVGTSRFRFIRETITDWRSKQFCDIVRALLVDLRKIIKIEKSKKTKVITNTHRSSM